jgi:hypothetical protein
MAMRAILAAWIGGAIVSGGAFAHAQEPGQLGLTMGYPTAIGAVWHATDRVGIRVEANFQTTSSELEVGLLGADREVETNSFGVNVAGLFYLGQRDNVSTYFSPRVGYSKSTLEQERPGTIIIPVQLGPFPLPMPEEIRTELSGFSVAGSFGAQYAPTRRFSVFGELGLSYSSQRAESSSFTATETEGSTFGVRSAVGVVLYFN